jgi:adenine-specific DNA methylase
MNTSNYPKRLIEVDLPIKRISAHARREKSIRHGHISTLHIWWARRPLAACRAVICAALWPDPADPLCPQEFRNRAATLITEFAKKAATDNNLSGHCSTENWSKWKTLAKPENKLDSNNPDHLNILRFRLLDFIADFANWDNSTQQDYLETSRALTQAAHEALGGIPGTKPLVVDPFAGGGAIPLEALRVGADAFASDLNPVAVLLNKVMLEYIPKYGQQLADEVRKWGQWVKEEAEKELAEFYPKDPDGATPIAYLWARRIVCEGPGCGAEVPLMRSLWLAKKSNHSIALQIIPNPEEKRVDFEIIEKQKSKWVVADKPNFEVKNPTFDGTVKRGSATCPCCGFTTPVASVRRQLKEHRGGAVDARLYCVVIIRPQQKTRFFRLPIEQDLNAVIKAKKKLDKQKIKHKEILSLLPDEPTPIGGGSGASRAFSQRNYGMDKFEDLFTLRQLLALTTLVRLVQQVGEKLAYEDDKGLANAVQTCLGLAVNRVADRCSSLCSYDPNPTMSGINHTFVRQAISMMWDFAEGDPTNERSGGWETSLKWLLNVLERERNTFTTLGISEISSATKHLLPDNSAHFFCSDPPYYDAVPYSDLSDFFYVWLKRTLPSSIDISFTDELTPKAEECIVDEIKGKDKIYFETTMALSMSEGCRILSPDGIGVIVFAHKSTSGWEAQLQALVNAGWTITGSWAIDTEMGTRLRARNSAALASSIHLVCRPRDANDIGDWRDVLQELPRRIHEWMPRLASEGVVGADAIFACLGPALEIFSRYSRVEKASGEQVTLKDYLEYVWAAVSKEALSMIFTDADATGFEEDARLTAMWMWTISAGTTDTTSDSSEPESETDDDEETSSKSTKTSGYVLEFDAARKIAQGLGAHLENLRTLIEVKGDKARLLPVSERAPYLLPSPGRRGAGGEVKAPPKRKKKDSQQLTLPGILSQAEETEESTDWGETAVEKLGNTVLDRIHQSMILFAAGRSEALKRFLVEDGVGADQRFWKLAQALSALYPNGTDEKRWVDGVLARKKGLGF